MAVTRIGKPGEKPAPTLEELAETALRGQCSRCERDDQPLYWHDPGDFDWEDSRAQELWVCYDCGSRWLEWWGRYIVVLDAVRDRLTPEGLAKLIRVLDAEAFDEEHPKLDLAEKRVLVQ